MRIARDSRKRIIVEENMLDYTEIRIDEDEIFQLEDSLQAVFDPYEEELPPKIKVSVKKESKSEKSKKNASTKNAD